MLQREEAHLHQAGDVALGARAQVNAEDAALLARVVVVVATVQGHDAHASASAIVRS